MELKGLAEKINEMGLKFGLWFEPEMVNKNSNLYREHPDWILSTPQRHETQVKKSALFRFIKARSCRICL